MPRGKWGQGQPLAITGVLSTHPWVAGLVMSGALCYAYLNGLVQQRPGEARPVHLPVPSARVVHARQVLYVEGWSQFYHQ